MKFRSAISIILGVTLLSSFIMVGCGNKDESSEGTATNQTATSQAASTQKTDTPKAPDEISIFYGTANLKFPEGVKPGDNTYLNKIAEMANVKFKEVIVPEYADFQTKFNLMISSGNIPDIVHCWFPEDVQKHGASGAFLELSDIIAKSPVISKKYTQSAINLMKDDSGNVYGLRALGAIDTAAAGIRMDLIDELNNGKVPVTPDEWYDVFKKQKAKYPDSVPYTTYGGVDSINLFFKAYGVAIGDNGILWQYKDGKIISGFEAPMCRDAILYHKKLYDEGLLDKTFVTAKGEDYVDKKFNKKMIIAPNNLNAVTSYVAKYIDNKVEGAIFTAGPLPKVDDSRVTDSDVYTHMPLIGMHCVSIAASTKNKDACVRVVETLLSDEVDVLTSWGIEGVDFTVVNGKKVATEDSGKTSDFRRMYAFMFEYGSSQNVEVLLNNQLSKVDSAIREKYRARVEEGLQIAYDQANKVEPDPVHYTQLNTDTHTKFLEAQELSKSIIIKAIIGETSMEQYDAQVADFLKKYQPITDEYNQKLPGILEKLK